MADDFGGFESFGPLFFDDGVVDVAGGRGQAILVEDGANVLRSVVEVAGEFDFLVADGGDFGDGAFEVGLHGVAHGVELHADGVNVMCGVRGPGWLGCGCESCCDGGANKCASIHARILLLLKRKGIPELGKAAEKNDKGGPKSAPTPPSQRC